MPNLSATTGLSNTNVKPQGSYLIQVLFYLFLYLFIVFVIGIFIHFTITPVFSFTPGGPGLVSIPGAGSDIVYWNTRKQPDPTVAVPTPIDSLSSFPFINSFSICFDVLLTNIASATLASNRLILYKTNAFPTSSPAPSPPPMGVVMTDYMNTTLGASMIVYVTDTNDMVVTFFCTDSNGNSIQYNCAPVKNLPIDTPFRISIVVEKNSFTVYLNARQVSQKIVPGSINLNSINKSPGAQRFYAAPTWASLPNQTVYVQNFHVWPYTISYPEVQSAQPSLAGPTDFTGKKAT
jgi:hypothetical protein